MLEHEPHVALLGRKAGGVGPFDLDSAAVGVLESGDDPQEGGLAASAGPQKSGQAAGGDGHGDVVQGDEVAEPLVDVLYLDTHLSGFSLGRMIDTITMKATETMASRKAVA